MAYLGSWKIDDALTFPANTHTASTGAATDADGAPAYRVYEDETSTPILTGTMALLDSANTAGFYTEQITLSAANGLEKGKCYTVYIEATVGGVKGTMSHTFQIEAEVDSNSVSNIGSGVITAAAIATDAIDADAIADNAINAGAIASDAITAAKIATGAITAAKFAADAITSTVVADNTITAAKIASDAITAAKLASDVATEIRSVASGTSDSGTTLTMVDAARTEADTDYWAGDWILFTSGTIAGQVRLITAFTPASDTITFAPATTQAVSTQTYEIIPAARIAGVLGDISGSVASVTGAVGSVTGNVGGNVTGTVGGFTAGAKAEIQTEAEDAIVTHRLDELLNADSDIDGAAPPTVGSVFHELMSKTAGSFTFDQTTDSLEALRDRGDAAWITATTVTVSAGGITSSSFAAGAIDATAIADGAIDAATLASDTITAAKIATGAITSAKFAAGAIDAAAIAADAIGASELATDAVSEITTSVLTTAMTEAYPTDGATMTVAQALYLILGNVAEFAISGTTLTVKKVDGSTTAATYTLDSATTPTSRTRAT
jgi:hypothetical protein